MEHHPSHERMSHESTIDLLLRTVFATTPWAKEVSEAAMQPGTAKDILHAIHTSYSHDLRKGRIPTTHATMLTEYVIAAGVIGDASINTELRVQSENIRRNPNFNIVKKELNRYVGTILSDRLARTTTLPELLEMLYSIPLQDVNPALELPQPLQPEPAFSPETARKPYGRLLSDFTDAQRQELAQKLKEEHGDSPAATILENLLLFTYASKAESEVVCRYLGGGKVVGQYHNLLRGVGHCRPLFFRYENYIQKQLQSQPESDSLQAKERLWQLAFLRAMFNGARTPLIRVLDRVPSDSREKAAETIRQAFLDMLVFTVAHPPENFAQQVVTVEEDLVLTRTHIEDYVR